MISHSSQAGLVTDAQTRLDQANSQFYQEVKKLGSNATPDQIQKLENQILTPAKAQWIKEITHVNQERTSDVRKGVMDSVKTHVGEKALRDWQNGVNKYPTTKPSNTPSSSKDFTSHSNTPNPPPEAPSEPEVVLDGSNVPNELTFPGKNPIKK